MYVFGLISKTGGVGKTTLAANLGAILADFGARVLLIDADPQVKSKSCCKFTLSNPSQLTN